MNFLLVMPRFTERVGQHYLMPLGLPYISASLKRTGFSVNCLNLNHHEGPIDSLLRTHMLQHDTHVVCTGGVSVHYSRIRDILGAARTVSPTIKTIIGGGVVSSEPEIVMNGLLADFGVLGEGEETIVELANAICAGQDPAAIRGIIYRHDSGRLKVGDSRPPIPDLDSIAFPDYEAFDMRHYLDMQMPNDERDLYHVDRPRRACIATSRSCPYSCTFCYHPIGKTYRQRSLDSVFLEIDQLVRDYSVNTLLILDELFSTNRRRLEEFCARISRYNIKWQAQLRVDAVDRELLRLMRESGCYVVSYGLESASDAILRSMRKRTTVPQIERALELTRESRIGIQGNFLFGDRAETWETAAEVLEWWLRHRQYQIWLVPVEVYPGTGLYHYAVETGVIQNRTRFIESGCPPVNLTQMDDVSYKRLLTLVFLLQHTYGKLPADVLNCEEEGINSQHGALYEVTVRCPHCERVVTYRHLRSDGWRKFGCKACHGRLDLPRFEAWSHPSVDMERALNYFYKDSDGDEIRKILGRDGAQWEVGAFMDGHYRIIRLFGQYYGVSGADGLNDIGRFHMRVVVAGDLRSLKRLLSKRHMVGRVMVSGRQTVGKAVRVIQGIAALFRLRRAK